VVDAGGRAPAAVAAPGVGGPDAGAAAPVADTLLEDARLALVQQRFRAAVALYRKLKAERPDDVDVRTGLGVALVMSDSTTAEALGYLREGVKADPRNATAWLALGIGLQNLGREAEAKGPYREYLKLKPTGAQAQEVREVLRLIP
jgi:Flp pilus assembly protein TadD